MCRLAAHGLLLGGAGAGVAEGTSVTSKFDSASDGASTATKPDPPTSTVGSARDDDVKSPDEDNKKDGIPTGTRKSRSSLTIRILRIPRKDELQKSGRPIHLFYTTVEMQVPTLADAVAAGVRAPMIRGSLPPTVEPPAGSLTPMSGQASQRSGP